MGNRSEIPLWRTRSQSKPKTAIVRPQPQVVVVQRSPSPMPRPEKKSMLPLAHPARDGNNGTYLFNLLFSALTNRQVIAR